MQGCGSEPPQSGLSLSGTITAAQGTNIDSDVNDPNQSVKFNNSPLQAQALLSPVTLAGYLTQYPTYDPNGDDNFSLEADPEDHYLVKLLKNEVVTLEISDWQPESLLDFSLAFYPVSNPELSEQVSDGLGRFEQLIAPENGTYRIVVSVISGASNYSLSIGTNTSLTAVAPPSTQKQFVSNQFIFHDKTLNALTTPSQQVASAQALGLSSTNNNKARRDEALTELAMIRLKGKNKSHQLLSSHSLSRPLMTRLQSKNKAKLSQKTQQRYATLQKLKELKQTFGSDAVSLNYIYQAQHIPNDPMYAMQWHYPLIALPPAWDLVKEHQASAEANQDSVIVAVVDTGVFLGHEDLTHQVVKGYDFIADNLSGNDSDPGIDSNPDDPGDGSPQFASSWHGTHVAGIIAGETDNNIGIAGIGINTKVMPIRVLGVKDGTTYDIIQGVKFAAGLDNDSNTRPKKAADIINMSLGSTDNDPALQAIIQQIAGDGASTTIMVAAAGNNASSELFYPAAYPEVISVSAVGANNQATPYSNFGQSIDVAAPGGNKAVDHNGDGQSDGILSSLVEGSIEDSADKGSIEDSADNRTSDYAYYQGTSMAAPHVAGVIALMKTIYPALSNQELQNLLQRGLITDDIGGDGEDNQYGAGLINAYKAVYEAKSLASGGSLPPIITSSATQLSFDFSADIQLITLSQIGSAETLSIDSIHIDVPWLSMIPSEATAQEQLGQYQISVNNTELEDGLYSGKIQVIANNGSEVSISVSLRVDSAPNKQLSANTGILYLFLIDSNDSIIQQSEPLSPVNGKYTFSFSNISPGYYYLKAGSDIDNDFTVCDLGESCGAWPVLAEPKAIHVDTNLSGLNFTATIDSAIYQPSAMTTRNKRPRLIYQRQAVKPLKGKALAPVTP